MITQQFIAFGQHILSGTYRRVPMLVGEVAMRLRSGALSATALADGAGVTRQAAVRHLKVLDGAGLVTHERHGREVLYMLDAECLENARVYLEMISAGWDRAVDSLRDMVEEQSEATSKKRRRL